MNNWRAKPSLGGIIGIVLTGLFLAGFGFILWLAFSSPFSFFGSNTNSGGSLETFGLALTACFLFLIAGLLGYRTWRFFQFNYNLDRSAFKIELGGKRQYIPMANIIFVEPAEAVLERLRLQASGVKASVPTKDLSNKVESRTFSQPKAGVINGGRLDTASAVDADFAALEREQAFRVGDVVEAGIDTVNSEKSEAVFNSENEPFVQNVQDEKPPKEVKSSTRKIDKRLYFGGQKGNLIVKFRPLTSWPGFYTNQGWLAGLGELQMYSTQPFQRSLLVRTSERTYVISPSNYEQFRIEYKLRRNLGATEEVEEVVLKGKFLSHPLWKDWLGRGLILTGVLLNLSLFAFLLWRLNDFPEIIRLHYNKFGTVDRLEPSGAIMWLPFIGLFAAVVNSAFGAVIQVRDRVPALLLYGAVIAVQIMVWIAVFGVITTSF